MRPARETAKLVTFDEALAMMDADLEPDIRALTVHRPGATHLVICEVLALDSSQAGHRQAVVVGRDCTNTIEDYLDVPGAHTGDVPSRFHYPVAYAEVPRVEVANGS